MKTLVAVSMSFLTLHLCLPHGLLHSGGDNLVKGVQCYELFGGIALKNNTFFFFHSVSSSVIVLLTKVGRLFGSAYLRLNSDTSTLPIIFQCGN